MNNSTRKRGKYMKTIMEELIERVSNGERFHIDFGKRNMKVGKEYLIKDGEYDRNQRMLCIAVNPNSVLDDIEILYRSYKYSMPSERSESKRKKYFKALPVEELDVSDMVNGESRELTQCILEGYILCNILTGAFKWNDDWGKWFWQSKNDPDLVILKKWIEK